MIKHLTKVPKSSEGDSRFEIRANLEIMIWINSNPHDFASARTNERTNERTKRVEKAPSRSTRLFTSRRTKKNEHRLLFAR